MEITVASAQRWVVIVKPQLTAESKPRRVVFTAKMNAHLNPKIGSQRTVGGQQGEGLTPGNSH